MLALRLLCHCRVGIHVEWNFIDSQSSIWSVSSKKKKCTSVLKYFVHKYVRSLCIHVHNCYYFGGARKAGWMGAGGWGVAGGDCQDGGEGVSPDCLHWCQGWPHIHHENTDSILMYWRIYQVETGNTVGSLSYKSIVRGHRSERSQFQQSAVRS